MVKYFDITNKEIIQISKSKPKKISILCTFKVFGPAAFYHSAIILFLNSGVFCAGGGSSEGGEGAEEAGGGDHQLPQGQAGGAGELRLSGHPLYSLKVHKLENF